MEIKNTNKTLKINNAMIKYLSQVSFQKSNINYNKITHDDRVHF